jgi:predicted O-methyltransferase YrrM
VRIVVTTPRDTTADEESAARDAARRHGMPMVRRERRSLEALARAERADAVLVLGGRDASLWLEDREHRWSAGMGDLRVRRLSGGERESRDAFLEAASLRPGDSVLDATLGIGMDALVAAAAVGPGGRVVGIEASPALAALVAEGLARHPAEAARRIEVVRGDASAVLAAMAPASFDVVVFDPMFRHAQAQARSFDVVRRLAVERPLGAGTLAVARRVARRWVVVKDGTPGWDLARLGLAPLPSARGAKRLYGRAPPLRGESSAG